LLSGVEKLLGFELTTLDLCSQSGVYDLSTTATPKLNKSYGKKSIEAICMKLAEIRAKTMREAPRTAVGAKPIFWPIKGTIKAGKKGSISTMHSNFNKLTYP